MKKSELQSIIQEEIKKVLKEAVSSTTVLDIMSDPKLTQAMDKLSTEIDQQAFMKIKDLYTKLYAELKKHE